MTTSLIDRYQPRWLYLDEFFDSLAADTASDKREAIALLIRDRLITDGNLNETEFRFLGPKPDILDPSWIVEIGESSIDWKNSTIYAPAAEKPHFGRGWLLIEIAAKCVQYFGAPAASATGRRKKTAVQQNAAKKTLGELYPDGLPDATAVSNPELDRAVNKHRQQQGLGAISKNSVLRAANRIK